MRCAFLSRIAFCVFCFFLIGSFGVSALGEVIHVPDDYATIQEAVDAAVDGDEIVVGPGVYTGVDDLPVVDMLGKAVWLHSSGGAEVTFIDGEGVRRGIYCSNYETKETRIEGFTVQHGWSGWGGGMCIFESSPTLTNCVFKENSAEHDGGGLEIYVRSNPTIIACTFENNTSGFSGGGVWNSISNPTLIDCIFKGNSTVIFGGGMYTNDRSDSTMINCIFIDNSVDWTGGGLCIFSSDSTLTDCTFDNNSASDFGGGISLFYCDAALAGCVFENNVSTGGGMYNYQSSPILTNCLFRYNESSNGGGVYLHDSISPNLIDCTFENNPSDEGGGMYIKESNPVLLRCVFRNNTSVEYGAGIYCNAGSPDLNGCVFEGNVSDFDAGGRYTLNGSSSVLTDCVFEGNSALAGGGGLATLMSDLSLINCSFTGNHAVDYGGGLNNDSSSFVSLSETTVCDNSPDQIYGEWIDDGGNCVTDDCDDCPTAILTVSPDPLIAGESVTFSITYGNAVEHTYLAYSLTGLGETYIPVLNVTLGLDHPIQVIDGDRSWKMTNDEGYAEHVFDVPEEAAGLDVWFQACQFELTTNVVETKVE